MELYVNGETNIHPMKKFEFQNNLSSVIKKYGILPFGFGSYLPTEKIFPFEFEQVEITLQKTKTNYSLKSTYKNRTFSKNTVLP